MNKTKRQRLSAQAGRDMRVPLFLGGRELLLGGANAHMESSFAISFASAFSGSRIMASSTCRRVGVASSALARVATGRREARKPRGA